MTTNTPSSPKSYRLEPKRRTVRRLILFLIAGALLGHQWWGTRADRSLEAQVAELRRAGEPVLPQDFQSPAVSPADNAANFLRAAADATPDTDEQWNNLDADVLGAPLTATEALRIRRVVETFDAARRHASAATTRPAVDWGEALVTPVLCQTGQASFTRQWRLGDFLGVAALLAHHDSNDAMALRHVREILFSSRATGRARFNYLCMTSAGLAQTAARRLNQISPTLRIGGNYAGAASSADVRQVIDDLLDESSVKENVMTMLRGDRAWRYDAIRSLADGQAPIRLVEFRSCTQVGWGDDLLRLTLKPLILRDGPLVLREIERAIAAVGERDWPAASNRMGTSGIRGHYLRHYFACTLMPDYSRYLHRHYMDLTDRRLAATALALRWYATEHSGRLPASLDELLPRYLPAVPLDPMARQQRLKYVADPRRPVVYSVGEEAVDDGGSDASRWPNVENPDPWSCRDLVVHLVAQPRRPADIDAVIPPPEAEPSLE